MNWKNIGTEELEREVRRLTEQLVAMRQELERRKGIQKPVVEVDFEKYVSEN